MTDALAADLPGPRSANPPEHLAADLQRLLSADLQRLLDEAVAAEICSAAVVGVAVDGRVVARLASGVLQRIGDDGTPIAAQQREAADLDTLFDLASVTKVFSAVTLLGLVADGALELDDPVSRWLPSYLEGSDGRAGVTLRHLLTHTSGLPATWMGWRAPFAAVLDTVHPDAPAFTATPLSDRAALVDDLARTPLGAPPGTRWEYACTGFNTAMLVAESATGRPWADLVQDGVLGPLGLRATGFGPDRARTAATEHQPEYHRGVVRGIVHDESSWSLGGVAANAGLFGPVDDVLALAEWIRGGVRSIGPADATVRSWLWEEQLPDVLGHPELVHGGNPFGASLGLRIGESWMGSSGSASRGHTGFTGTSVQIDRDHGVSIVLLTNRVHPSRNGTGTQALRTAVADRVLRPAAPGRADD